MSVVWARQTDQLFYNLSELSVISDSIPNQNPVNNVTYDTIRYDSGLSGV